MYGNQVLSATKRGYPRSKRLIGKGVQRKRESNSNHLLTESPLIPLKGDFLFNTIN